MSRRVFRAGKIVAAHDHTIPLTSEERKRLAETAERIGIPQGELIGRMLDEWSEPRPSEIAAAYVQDRAEQYRNDSGSRIALEDVAAALRDGAHIEAFAHGELDDILARKLPRRAGGAS